MRQRHASGGGAGQGTVSRDPLGTMRPKLGIGLIVVLVVVVSLPLSFVITIFLGPLWRWLEARWGIEAIGHSGPAEWCFYSVWGLMLAAAALAWWLAARSARKASPPRSE